MRRAHVRRHRRSRTRPEPVAWLARDLGANCQNVQRIINDLHKEGLVAFAANPHHRRAQLVVLTDKGRRMFDAAVRLQASRNKVGRALGREHRNGPLRL